ncbi:GDSL-type esterase/lipase family protein [Aestuariivivens sediminis]|uniref:GDSL-type esterase/lipase family protein n=1 Tax=Aestuariivivens sediminis TaxID=2913557 RepID=UPI001F574C1B|nr:GDSL-type esterase/lipase family protein [Aestuariivivens sediminis]
MKTLFLMFYAIFYFTNMMAQEIDTTFFSPKYYHMKSVFELLPDQKDEIVFLGNSITEQGRWRELFNKPNVINRGIGGDRTDGILYRLEEVTASKPKKIFLLIGTNDLGHGKSPSYITAKIHQIIRRIKSESSGTLIFLQSILPTYHREERPNQSIKEINDQLKRISTEENIVFIDLFSSFIDESGTLDKVYSLDGLHLNGLGYLKWKELIENYVNE